jgi:hypothetical protein
MAMKSRPLTLRRWLVGLVCLSLAGSGFATAADNASGGDFQVYQVEAAYLYNFTKFTDWPATSFSSSNAPLVIGIVGADPFGKTIDAVMSGEVVRGHPLVVKRLRADDDFQGCHILFFSHSEKKRLPDLLNRIRGWPALSVGEISGFAEQGGMVNLIVTNQTVKMEINRAVSEQAGLKISSKLLKLARVVLKNSTEGLQK